MILHLHHSGDSREVTALDAQSNDATPKSAARDETENSELLMADVRKSSALRRGHIRSFLDRHRDQLIRDALVGLSLAIVAFALAAWWDNQAAERQETIEAQRFQNQQILENTRFARELSLTSGPKPLSGLDLQGTVLNRLTLSGADFAYTNLNWAQLLWTDLSGADFTGAGLARADLSWADLTEASLINADLSGADLTEATFHDATFIGADLSEADLSDADLTGAEMWGADLSRADLGGAEFKETNLRGADLSGAELAWAHLSEVNLSEADLRGADFTGATLSGIYFDSERVTDEQTGVCYDSSTEWPIGYEPDYEPYCDGRFLSSPEQIGN